MPSSSGRTQNGTILPVNSYHNRLTIPDRGFTWRYNVDRLVYYEIFESPDEAIAREKRVKKWKRAWKVALIERENPEWLDLADRFEP